MAGVLALLGAVESARADEPQAGETPPSSDADGGAPELLRQGAPAVEPEAGPPITQAPTPVQLPPPVMTVPIAEADAKTTRWQPRRELRFTTADYVITGVAVSGILVGSLATPSGRRWRGGILFDEAARDTLRLGSLQGRYWVRDMSDVGISLSSTWPFLVDALVTAWWYHGRADVAYDMALVSAEAFTLAAAVQSMGNLIGSRERPFGRLCGKTIPEQSVDCEPDVRYRSFFSGHATLGFTGAGLVCMNHLGLGLLGEVGDTLSCVGGYTVATTTSLFRVMSDMHYASDAIIGAIVGTAAGIGIPLLHFRRVTTASGVNVDWHLGAVGEGLGVEGTF